MRSIERDLERGNVPNIISSCLSDVQFRKMDSNVSSTSLGIDGLYTVAGNTTLRWIHVDVSMTSDWKNLLVAPI